MSGTARRALGRAGLPLGLVAGALLVWHTSGAAFSATTTNPGNNWTSGTVALADDASNSAMFSASGLKPGSTGSRCIQVNYSGTLAAAVKFYVGSLTTGTPDLSPYVQLTIDEGSGATYAGGCGSFVGSANLATGVTLTALAAARTNYATGLGTWAPSGAASKSYRISYTVDSAAPNSVQGGGSTATFTWEAQNT